MKRSFRICGLALLVALLAAPQAWAQDDAPSDDEETTVEEAVEDDPAEDVDEDTDEEDTTEDIVDEEVDEEADEEVDEEADEEVEETVEPPEPDVAPQTPPAPEAPEEVPFDGEMTDEEEDWPEDWDEAFEDDADFVPLEVDDDDLDRITPESAFPFVEYDGMLRVRSRARINFDLDTGGTSAVLPPLDSVVPAQEPANPDASMLWSTDIRLRLAPSFHLSEGLRLHTDFDFLRNVGFGADPRHSYFQPGTPSADRRLMSSSAGGANPVHVRQAYGEADTPFGTIMAGRMLNHWGLGIFANDGNCADCDWGDQVDRLALRTRVFVDHALYLQLAYDFPDVGVMTDSPGFQHGAPHELARLDTTNQWTVSAFHTPLSRQDRQRQAHRLGSEERPVYNGGLYFSGRTRSGEFSDPDAFDPDNPTDPIYRGLSLYTAAPWVQLLWNPDSDRRIRLELEGFTTLGRVDNPSDRPVGFEENTGEPVEVNCFDSDEREQNIGACTTDDAGQTTSERVTQFGLAMESEFHFGGPVSFGINGGFATGGDAQNWGYGATAGQQLDYTRFNPDYHVDLILFREVIGTVTNAYYANPYVVAEFLDRGPNQRMEFQLDAIASRAFDTSGAPGDSPWLGLEFDSSLRFLASNAFEAALDAGVLFPLGGLGAVAGQDRLNAYGDLGPFVEDQRASLAWTVQGRLLWRF